MRWNEGIGRHRPAWQLSMLQASAALCDCSDQQCLQGGYPHAKPSFDHLAKPGCGTHSQKPSPSCAASLIRRACLQQGGERSMQK
jgi:hypothetical protein